MKVMMTWCLWCLPLCFGLSEILDPELLLRVKKYQEAKCVHLWYNPKTYRTKELGFHLQIGLLFISFSRNGSFFASPDLNSKQVSHLLSCFSGPALNVLIINQTPIIEEFQVLTRIERIRTDAIWLLISNTLKVSLPNILSGFPLFLNCRVLVARPKKPGWYLEDVYQSHQNLSLQITRLGEIESLSQKSFLDKTPLIIRRKDFQGAELIVYIIDEHPIGFVNYSNGKIISQKGYLPQLWEIIEQHFNFRSHYIYNSTLRWGSFVDGQWTGIVGILGQNGGDVGLGGFINIPARKDVIDFAMPVLNNKFHVYIRDWQEEDQLKWGNVFAPFDLCLWIMILISWPIYSLMFNLLHSTAKRYGLDNTQFSLGDCLFCVLGIYCQQGYPYMPKACSVRIIYLALFLNALIFLASFSASLISSLAVSIRIWPFTSIQGLIRDGSYSFSVLKDSAEYSIFKDSKDPLAQLITEKYLLPPMEASLPKDAFEAFNALCRPGSRISFMTYTLSAVAYMKSLPCTIIPLPKHYARLYLGPIFSKYNPYQKFINYGLMKTISSGIMKRIKSHTWHIIQNPYIETFTSVTFWDIIPILVIWLLGVIGAMIFLIFENLIAQYFKKQNQKIKKR